MSPAKPRVVLSANATPRAGGQGLNLQHMIEALGPISDLAVVDQRKVPESRIARAMNRTPIVNRRTDWTTLATDIPFDTRVAMNLPQGETFIGVVGQCATTMRVAKKRGMRTVLDVVNTHVDDYQEHVTRESKRFQRSSFIHPWMRERILREYEQADVIRVMSEVAKRTFEVRGVRSEKILVATPPMNVADFPVAKFEDPIFRVIFVGMVVPWKGFHLLVEAFARLNLPRSELVLWGGTGARTTARFIDEYRERHPNIHIRRVAIRTAGLDEVYGKASVLVHPSLSDGFAYVVTEAMAAGLPVVVTDNTGAADLVRQGENGYVIPTGSVRAIEETLEELYRHRDRLPEMGRRARATAETLTVGAFRSVMAKAIGVDTPDESVAVATA